MELMISWDIVKIKSNPTNICHHEQLRHKLAKTDNNKNSCLLTCLKKYSDPSLK